MTITPAAADGGGDSAGKWSPRGEVGGYVGNKNLSRGEVGLFVPLYQNETSLFFADLKGRFFDGDTQEGNFALGYREMLANGWNLGVWTGLDVRRSTFDNVFPQVAGGLEFLHPDLGFRLNGYLPLNSSDTVSTTTMGGGGGGPTMLQLIGQQLFLVTPRRRAHHNRARTWALWF